MPTILELFCGTKSVSKVFDGWDKTTVDIDPQFEPSVCTDILYVEDAWWFEGVDFIWASPPCEKFSVSSIGKYWNKDHTPKTEESESALRLLEHTIEIIKRINPSIGFIIENPRGKMRKMPIMQEFNRYTVTYCQYGDVRMKPTDLFTNLELEFKPICKYGATCHILAPRGSKTGTQGMGSYIEKSVIPEELCKSIYEQINRINSNTNCIKT